MKLASALLAALLPTALGSYVIQNDDSKKFIFVEHAGDRHSAKGGDIFAASRRSIEQHHTSRYMYFDLVPVDDAYMIVNTATQLALFATTVTRRSYLGFAAESLFGASQAVKAKPRSPGDDLSLWHLTISPNIASYITNKRTGEYLYVYEAPYLFAGDASSVHTTKNVGMSLMGSSMWVIKKFNDPLSGE